MERKTPVGMTAPTAGGSTPMIDDFIIRQISRAELLVGSDQIEEAISTLNEILKLNPDSTHAHMKLKDVYLRAGMKQQAAEECLQLARIYESQGERASANDYLVRARFLSPTTGTLPAKVRPIQPVANGNQPVNGKAPSATNGATVAKRPAQPDSKTGPDSVRAAGGIQQPAPPVRSIPESDARQVPDATSVLPKSPAPAVPANSVTPRTPGSQITVPELSIDAGTRFLKTDLADIRRAVLGEDLSAEAANDMEPLPLYEVDSEPESVDPRTLHASTSAAPQSHVQVVAAPVANVVTSPLEKSRGKGRWLYRTAIAVVLLAGTAVGGGFWFNSRLDRQFATLNREYEEAAYASSYALAQADIIEDVTPDSVVVDSPTEDVQPAAEETPRTRAEQELQDRRTLERQQALAASRAAEQQLASVIPTKPETKKSTPLPPLTSQLSVIGTQPVSDNRTPAVMMNAGAALGPPEPPPPAPSPARKVVVSAEAISKVQPSYPRTAVTARVSGAVAVLVTVNEQGNVVEARAISGPSLLWGAAVDAARRWKFKPSTIGGVAAKTSKTIVFNFKSDR